MSTELQPFETGPRKRASVSDVTPGRIDGQIHAILHGVPEVSQICLGNLVPLPLDLPAESSSVLRAVWQLVDPTLQKAPQILDWV